MAPETLALSEPRPSALYPVGLAMTDRSSPPSPETPLDEIIRSKQNVTFELESKLALARANVLSIDQARHILGRSPLHHRYNPECYCVRCEDITGLLLRICDAR